MHARVILAFVLILALLARPTHAQDQQPSADHVAPAAPQQTVQPMSELQMADAMQMDDKANFAMFKLDEFERGFGNDGDATNWNGQAWYGGDIDKLWLRSEGERQDATTDARIEAFFDHAFATYWDWQLGVRRDFGSAPGIDRPSRNWAAFGVQGLAPYWFDIEATAYVGEQGRSAARFRAEYELLLSQRLIVTPELELNLYGNDDRLRERASGLADAQFGVRLRYEIYREFAPYVGVVWNYRRGLNSTMLPSADRAGTDCQIVIGLRLWL